MCAGSRRESAFPLVLGVNPWISGLESRGWSSRGAQPGTPGAFGVFVLVVSARGFGNGFIWDRVPVTAGAGLGTGFISSEAPGSSRSLFQSRFPAGQREQGGGASLGMI